MDGLAQKIKDLRKAKKLTQKDLAVLLDVAPTAVSAWELGRNKPLMDKIEQLANIFEIRKSELLGEYTPSEPQSELITAINDKVVQLTTPRQENVLGYATGQLEEQKREERAESIIEEDNIIRFAYDYYDHAVSAGTGQYLSDVAVETIELPLEVNADFVVPVQGSSMQPDYNDGDYAFIKLSYNLSDGDIGVFYYNGDAYIKQLCIDGKKAYLHSLNPAYPDMPITEDIDFRIIGEVVNIYRG